MPEQSEGITQAQNEALRNPFPGIDVDALLSRINDVADIDRGELCAVLSVLAEDGRLIEGDMKMWLSDGLDHRTHFRRVGPWLPVVSDTEPTESDIANLAGTEDTEETNHG